MKVKAWGTRGSIAISNADSVRYGGNTTCFEVLSECFPDTEKVIIDAGTGLIPAAWNFLEEMNRGVRYNIFFTHWHYDHIVGMTLAPPTFIDQMPMSLYGPVDAGAGPREMIGHLFKRPFFPVDAKQISHKMEFVPLENFDVMVIVGHARGGFVTFSLDTFKILLKNQTQVEIRGNNYDIGECMVIRMARTSHGGSTCISYRFEENPTGKVFVFCSDHEDVFGVPVNFRWHLANADLLIADAQYNDEKYHRHTAGFGHGTPYGVVKQSIICNVRRVGITHHDPGSTDTFLTDTILAEAREAFENIKTDKTVTRYFATDDAHLTDRDIFLCEDFAEYEV